MAGTVSVIVGQTSQFQAVGIYTESGHATSSKDVSGQVTWVSSNTAVATISASGLATAVAAGKANITATVRGAFGTVSASSDITVVAGGASTQRLLTSLTVTPTTQTVTATQTAQLLAIGTFSSGSPATQNLTGQVTWQSSDATVATVNSSGLVTGVALGTATVTALATASDGSVVSASSIITVVAGPSSRTLASLAITPSTQTVAANGNAQLLAIGTYSSGSPATQNLTSSVTWQTSSSAVATVSATGVVTGVAAGQATISAVATAADGSAVSASALITVSGGAAQRTLTSLTLTPTTQSIAPAATSQLIAIGNYSSGSPSTANLTSSVTWQTSSASIATVNSTGLVTGVSPGTVTITAVATAADGSAVTGTASITVGSGASQRVLSGLTVTPTTQTVTANQAAQLLAIGTYTSGSPTSQNLTGAVTWTSSDVSIASVSSSGIVTGAAPGQVTITALATDGTGLALTASSVVTVASGPSQRELVSLQVVPSSADVQIVSVLGETAQFLAIGTYNSGSPTSVDLTNQVKWVSSDVAVATVNAAGLATITGSGQATITAEATAGDLSAVFASGAIKSTASQGPVTLPTLAVYLVGAGSGTVTGHILANGTVGSDSVINCSSNTQTNSAQCTGNFAAGTEVLLHGVPSTGTQFDGWSSNCSAVGQNPGQPISGSNPADPTSCALTLSGSNTVNYSVGAIFDPITP